MGSTHKAGCRQSSGVAAIRLDSFYLSRALSQVRNDSQALGIHYPSFSAGNVFVKRITEPCGSHIWRF